MLDATSQHGQRLVLIDRFRRVARLLDTGFVLPGTQHRFGLDPLIGLVPGIGDLLSAGVSAWLIHIASQLGVPRALLLRMMANVALDTVIGAVPVLGDLFDFAWTANRRNRDLLEAFLKRDEADQKKTD